MQWWYLDSTEMVGEKVTGYGHEVLKESGGTDDARQSEECGHQTKIEAAAVVEVVRMK